MFDLIEQFNAKRFNFPREYCRECDEVVNLLSHVEKTGHMRYGKLLERERLFDMPDSPHTDLQAENNSLAKDLQILNKELTAKDAEIAGLKSVITKLTQALSDKPKNPPDSPVPS